MQAGADRDIGFVLHVGENIAKMVNSMIVYQRDDADNFAIALADFLLDEMVPNQIADRFRTVLVAHAADTQIECR